MDKFYKTIASLDLKHEFFLSKSLPGATLHPMPDAQIFFRNHRMVFKRKKEGYVLLHETNIADNTATIGFDAGGKDLFFGVKFNDQQFQLRSGLNFDPRREKIAIKIKDGGNFSVSAKDVMPVLNSPGSFVVEAEISDDSGTMVYKAGESAQNVFAGLDDGIYFVGDKPFLKCGNAAGYDAVLIFGLREKKEMAGCTVTMPAGRYLWRYQVLKKYAKHMALSLVDENEKVSFSKTEIENSDTSIFLSSEPVPVTEELITSLVLYNNENIVKKFLPLPQLEQARFLSAEDKSLVLEAYVTI